MKRLMKVFYNGSVMCKGVENDRTAKRVYVGVCAGRGFGCQASKENGA